MTFFFNKYGSIKYVEKNTGFRPYDLNRHEFHELKNTGWRKAAEIDFEYQRRVINGDNSPPNPSPLTLFGELLYLYDLYEQRQNKLMMKRIIDTIDIFKRQYKNEIQKHGEVLFISPKYQTNTPPYNTSVRDVLDDLSDNKKNIVTSKNITSDSTSIFDKLIGYPLIFFAYILYFISATTFIDRLYSLMIRDSVTVMENIFGTLVILIFMLVLAKHSNKIGKRLVGK
jgi:hypothetical protein